MFPSPAGAQCDAPFLETSRASDGTGGEEFGSSVVMSGMTAAVAAPFDDQIGLESGAVYLFRRTATGWIETQKLVHSQVAAGDRFGTSLAMQGDRLVIGASQSDLEKTNGGAAFVYRLAGTTWIEEQTLIPSNIQGGDFFGTAVAIDGDVIAVGALGEDTGTTDAGSAYLFRFDGSSWQEEQMVFAGDPGTLDSFGLRLDVEDDVLVVGAPLADHVVANAGAAYVFRHSAGAWSQEQKLIGSLIANPGQFGNNVAVSDGMVFVTAYKDSPGNVYCYRDEGGSWVEDQLIFPEVGATLFGTSLVVEDGMMVVGGRTIAGPSMVRVLEFKRDHWVVTEELSNPEGSFAESVGVSEAGVLVGSPGDDGSGNDAGAVECFDYGCNPCAMRIETQRLQPLHFLAGSALDVGDGVAISGGPGGGVAAAFSAGVVGIYERESDGWSQVASFEPLDVITSDRDFGASVAIDGDVALVGMPGDFEFEFGMVKELGSAYFYRKVAGVWGREHTEVHDPATIVDEDFGRAVDIDGNLAVVGNPGDLVNGERSGAVHLFRYEAGAWTEIQVIRPPDGRELQRFGHSVAMDGGRLVVGAPEWESLTSPGSVYCYEWDGTQWNSTGVLAMSAPRPRSQFGHDVDLLGGLLVVGAPKQYQGNRKGAVYVYRYDGGWSEEQRIVGQVDGYARGLKVACDGDVIVASGGFTAPIHVYRFDGTLWNHVETLNSLESGLATTHGVDVSIHGDVMGVVDFDDLASAPFSAKGAVLFYEPTVFMDASPEVAYAGDQFTLRTCGGKPNGLFLLFAVELNGTPSFTKLLLGSYDSLQEWEGSLPLLPGLEGLDVLWQVFGQGVDGNLHASNRERTLFR